MKKNMKRTLLALTTLLFGVAAYAGVTCGYTSDGTYYCYGCGGDTGSTSCKIQFVETPVEVLNI